MTKVATPASTKPKINHDNVNAVIKKLRSPAIFRPFFREKEKKKKRKHLSLTLKVGHNNTYSTLLQNTSAEVEKSEVTFEGHPFHRTVHGTLWAS